MGVSNRAITPSVSAYGLDTSPICMGEEAFTHSRRKATHP